MYRATGLHRNPTEAVSFTGREWLAIVKLADKYQMDHLSKVTISKLQVIEWLYNLEAVDVDIKYSP